MLRPITLIPTLALMAFAGACGRSEPKTRAAKQPAPAPPPAQVSAPKPAVRPAGCGLPALATRYPAARRVIAIGDIHGDVRAARRALRLAGAINDKDDWAGGDLVVVQLGDILDRGNDEQQLLDWFERLRGQAAQAGGALHVLNGNHETMNARGDFSYVTPGGYADFEDAPGVAEHLRKTPAEERGKRARVLAFAPGGVYAKLLAGHNTVVVIGDTLFVHGGVLPDYARYGLARLNREIRCWLAGNAKPPALLADANNPLWSRDYSMDPAKCDLLEGSLKALKLRRMVVAHTVQRKINSACGGRVWRIDVGLAAHYGGATQVLELTAGGVKVLR